MFGPQNHWKRKVLGHPYLNISKHQHNRWLFIFIMSVYTAVIMICFRFRLYHPCHKRHCWWKLFSCQHHHHCNHGRCLYRHIEISEESLLSQGSFKPWMIMDADVFAVCWGNVVRAASFMALGSFVFRTSAWIFQTGSGAFCGTSQISTNHTLSWEKKNLTLICLFFSNKRHLPLFAHHVISHFIPSAQYSIAAWFTGIYPRSFVQGAKWDRDAPTDGQCIQTTNWDDNLENYYLGIVKSQ